VTAFERKVSAEKKNTPEAFFHAFGVALKVFFIVRKPRRGKTSPSEVTASIDRSAMSSVVT
jgi:hypothetical protein